MFFPLLCSFSCFHLSGKCVNVAGVMFLVGITIIIKGLCFFFYFHMSPVGVKIGETGVVFPFGFTLLLQRQS